MLCNAWVSVIFQDTDRGRRSGSWRDWRSAMALKDSVSEVSPFCLPSSVGWRPAIQLAMKKRFRSGYRTNRNHREGPGNWWPQALTARAKVRTAAPDPYLDMLHAALNALNFYTVGWNTLFWIHHLRNWQFCCYRGFYEWDQTKLHICCSVYHLIWHVICVRTVIETFWNVFMISKNAILFRMLLHNPSPC